MLAVMRRASSRVSSLAPDWLIKARLRVYAAVRQAV